MHVSDGSDKSRAFLQPLPVSQYMYFGLRQLLSWIISLTQGIENIWDVYCDVPSEAALTIS